MMNGNNTKKLSKRELRRLGEVWLRECGVPNLPPCLGSRTATLTGANQKLEPAWLRAILERSEPEGVLVSGWPVRVPKLVR